jgi:hypothetical protein
MRAIYALFPEGFADLRDLREQVTWRPLTNAERETVAAAIWAEVRQHPETATCQCPAVAAEYAIHAVLASDVDMAVVIHPGAGE